MALDDVDLGVKILGGLAAFALLMAVLSNGEPDNDAWVDGDPAGAAAASDEADAARSPDDPWLATAPEDGGELPACDGTAPFVGDGGTIRTPVYGPITPFASPACRLEVWHGEGDAVQLLQHALGACNGQPVAVDGGYGPQTRQAVAAVQAEHGIEVDGTYGPDTGAVMAWPIVADDAEEGCGTLTGRE